MSEKNYLVTAQENFDRDYKATLLDIKHLRQAADGIRNFLFFAGGENRESLGRDLIKWDGLLNEAWELKAEMETYAVGHELDVPEEEDETN